MIFYYHNVTPPELWGSDADRKVVQAGMEGKRWIHFADFCVTDSEYNKEDLIEQTAYDPDRIIVLPLGVPLVEFTPGAKDSKLVREYRLEGQSVLVFVGRMAGNKRIDILVEALAKIIRQQPNTMLLLVGDQESAPAYREISASAQERADEMGIAQNIVWTGRVAELPRYLRLADVYITASLHEGFGVPLIEAMACGVPVVASRSGAMPWVLGHAGLTFDPGDAQDLADKVLNVLSDPSLRETLITRGLERSRGFSLEKYHAGLGKIVDSAVAYTLPDLPVEITEAAHEKPSSDLELSGTDELAERKEDPGVTRSTDLLAALQEVRSRAWVNPHLHIAWPTWPKGLWPKVVAFTRKVVRRLLRWYVNPIVEQQNQFNAASVRAIELLWKEIARQPLQPDEDLNGDMQDRHRT